MIEFQMIWKFEGTLMSGNVHIVSLGSHIHGGTGGMELWRFPAVNPMIPSGYVKKLVNMAMYSEF